MNGKNLDLKPLIQIVSDGCSLTEDQSKEAFDIIMTGNATPSQIGGFLMARGYGRQLRKSQAQLGPCGRK